MERGVMKNLVGKVIWRKKKRVVGKEFGAIMAMGYYPPTPLQRGPFATRPGPRPLEHNLQYCDTMPHCAASRNLQSYTAHTTQPQPTRAHVPHPQLKIIRLHAFF